MQAPPAGVACFKCGKTGHWSRDCTVPPAEWIRKALPARPKAPEAAATPGAAPNYQRQEAARPSFAQYGNTPTPGTAPRTQPKGQGCFKCGKTGHWSRDCTAPPSEQLPKAPFVPNADFGPTTQSDPPTASNVLKPRKADPKKQRRIKIRFEHLKEKDAVAEVFHQFPERFARQFKGKGHEVSDLRRLLEMYRTWQRKYFPRHDFDEAIHQIADLGRSNRLKVELREMREGVLRIIKSEEQEIADKAAAAAAAAAQHADGEGAEAAADAMEVEDDAGPAADWDDDDEDDDLVALQQQGWEDEADAAPLEMLDAFAPVQATAQDAQPIDMDVDQPSLEDQELLALAAEPMSLRDGENDLASNEPSCQPVPDLPQISPEDEELLALAEAPLSQVQEAQPSAQDAAAQPMQNSPWISPEDEELLALAEAPLSQVQEAQPSGQDAAAQQSPQISPEDEELLALAAAPLSQSEAAEASPSAQHIRPAQGTWQLSAEDEELLALASASEAQPGSAPAAYPAAQVPCMQPGSVPSFLSPEDEELCALAAAPLTQPGAFQAVVAAGKEPQQYVQAQAQASAGIEELLAPPHASISQDVEGSADCSTPAPAPCSRAHHTPTPQQPSAGAQVAPQGSMPDAESSPDHRESLMLAPGPSSCHEQSGDMVSQPHITTKHDAVLPGKENAADQSNIKIVQVDTGSSGKEPTTAVDNLPTAYKAQLDGVDDEDAELLALL